MDSDDETDLSERLAGIDLEDSGALWQSLTQGERAEFRSLVESGDIAKYVPEFRPWWDYRFRPAKKVQPLEESQQEVERFTQQMTARMPEVMEKVKLRLTCMILGGFSCSKFCYEETFLFIHFVTVFFKCSEILETNHLHWLVKTI